MNSLKSKETLFNLNMAFGKNRLNVFQKIERVRSLVFEAVGEMTDKEFESL